MTLPAMTGPRDLRDAKRLADLEVTITAGLSSFVTVGEALLEVRDSRLYRVGYPTFEAYCKGRWGMTDRRGRQLMEATEAVKALPTGTTVPVNEAQARELTPVIDQPEALRSVWAGVVDQAEATDTRVTAPIIRAAVRDYIRGQAATSEAEMREASAWMTAEEREAVAPEVMRQRGELMRLIADLNRLPDAASYARLHGPELRGLRFIDGSDFFGQAMYACGWLETFCDVLEDKR